MGSKNIEIWVVDTPAALTILEKIRNPVFNKFLEDKIIVVPLTVCNDVFNEMRFGLGERYNHSLISNKVDKIAILADALRSATSQAYEDDEGLFFARDYSCKSAMLFPKVKFAFVLDAINLRDTVDYCNRENEMVTRDACDFLGVDFGSIQKWAKVNVIESIKEVQNDVFLCEFY